MLPLLGAEQTTSSLGGYDFTLKIHEIHDFRRKTRTVTFYQNYRPDMAEKERFELSRRFPDLHP